MLIKHLLAELPATPSNENHQDSLRIALYKYSSCKVCVVAGHSLNSLGLRTSWLRRETYVLGKFLGLLSAAVALLWFPVFEAYIFRAIVSIVPSWAAKSVLAGDIAEHLRYFSSATYDPMPRTRR